MTRSETRSAPPPITTITHPDPQTALLFVLAVACGTHRAKQTDPGLPRGAAVVDAGDVRFLVITDTRDPGHLRDVFVAYAPTYSVLIEAGLHRAAAWVRQVLRADDPMAAAATAPTDAPAR